MKLTPQRRIIVDTIHDSRKELTAESIIAAVQSKMPEVHKSTIYRNLDMLEKTGCVFKSEKDNHIVYHHAEQDCHCHLVCNACGKIIECDEEFFRRVADNLSDRYGFSVHFKHMVIEGFCKECTESKIE
jgi:Fur family ferric uptake transcriptional regulator